MRCVLETGRLAYHRWDEHTQIYFEQGWMHTWAPPLLMRNAVAEVELYRSAAPPEDAAGAHSAAGASSEHGVRHSLTRPLPEPRWSWAYRREAEHFVDCLLGGAPFRSSGEDTRTDVRLFEDLYRAHLGR